MYPYDREARRAYEAEYTEIAEEREDEFERIMARSGSIKRTSRREKKEEELEEQKEKQREKKQDEEDAREQKKHKHFASAERATVDAGILEMARQRGQNARKAYMVGNYARAKQIASKKGMTPELEEELVMYRVHPTQLMKEAGDSWKAACRVTLPN